MNSLDLLKRQYLQLLEPEYLTLPSSGSIRLPHVQAYLYETMFREGCLRYPPPDRYEIRVLKRIIEKIESSFIDTEEDVGIPISRILPFEQYNFAKPAMLSSSR